MGLFDATQAALEQALIGSSLRHNAIANNLANANTPLYKRTDVDFASALEEALEDGKSAAEIRSITFSSETDARTAMRADGNNVDFDAEMAALNENTVTYQALMAVAKARLNMIEIVIGGR